MIGPLRHTYEADGRLEQYRNNTHIVYASAMTDFTFIKREVPDIVDEIVKARDSGKTKFVFHNSPETLLTHILKKCQIVAKMCDNIRGEDFIFHTSGLDAAATYNELSDKLGWSKKINILVTHHFEQLLFNFIQQAPKTIFDPYVVCKKDKNFVCFNKIPRGHRVRLLARMISSDLINSSYYSFEGDSSWISNLNKIYDESTVQAIMSRKDDFPMRLNITSDRNNPVDIIQQDIDYHTNSYFSVVTETVFYNTSESDYYSSAMSYANSRFLTEKTYRPIALKHPFILVAFPNSLSSLHDRGFKTFHPHIDESYDTISDSKERLDAIVEEIARLCSFTDAQWIEWQIAIKPIVEHNFSVLSTNRSYLHYPSDPKFFFDS